MTMVQHFEVMLGQIDDAFKCDDGTAFLGYVGTN
jgi:hypothetical protein